MEQKRKNDGKLVKNWWKKWWKKGWKSETEVEQKWNGSVKTEKT